MKICRLCQGPIGRHDSRGGLECLKCESLVVEEVPSMETLSDFYADFNSRYTGGGSSGGKNQIRYAQRYLQLIHKHSRKGKLLDMGCANNPLPNVANSAGFEVTAMDYSRPDQLDPGVLFAHGHLNSPELLQSDEKFDVVTSWAVIEHVADPDLAFAIFARLLKKGGQLHLTTPEYGTSLTQSSAGKTKWFYPPEHLHLISPKAMQIIANRHGLELVEWRHFEISSLRWLARYGIGLAETLMGWPLKTFLPSIWEKRKQTKTTRYIGIAYYRFNFKSTP